MLPVSTVIASTAVLVVLLVTFGYLYLSERKTFILAWLLSVFALLVTYLSRLPMLITGWEGIPIQTINYMSTVTGYLFVYIGTRKFCGKQVHYIWSLLAILLSFSYVLLLELNASLTLTLILSLLYCSAILAVAGFTAISSEKLKGSIKHILGRSFIVWSACTFMFPLCRLLKILSLDIGYITIGVAGLITFISLQSAYFINMRDELISKENKIRKLVMYDKLTGAYNRAYFEEISETLFDDFHLPAVLALGDINGLKLINDTFGHKQGDELLMDAVKVIRSSVREDNIIIRWGGDEFIIIMPMTTMEEADSVIEGIKSNCKSFNSKTIPIDISIGLSPVENRDHSLDEVIAQAEERMYNRKLNESRQTRRTIIDFLERLLWEKDYQTEEHVLRLKSLVLKIGKRIGLSPKEIDELAQVALLHDIGKIAVPAEILKKPGSLTPAEWEIMKKHSETGYRIAQSSREFAHISESILGHHEWWNGTGYPQRLKGEEIPLYSRIVAIVDSYDVITHDRPYKQAIDPAEALNEIRKNAGIQYDPFLADVFINVMLES